MRFEKFTTQKIIGAMLLLVAFIFFFNTDSSAQKISETVKADMWERAAVAFDKDVSDYYFSTPYGKACATILIKAHKSAFQYPKTITEDISGENGKVISDLLNELQQLRSNPPTWEAILKAEEARLEIDFAPPTAPVFAGDVAPNQHRSNQLNNRHGNKNIIMKSVDLTQSEDKPEEKKSQDSPQNVEDEKVEKGKEDK